MKRTNCNICGKKIKHEEYADVDVCDECENTFHLEESVHIMENDLDIVNCGNWFNK